MSTLFTVDPGKCYVGCAKFDNGVLVHAQTVRSKKPWPEGAVEVADKLRAFGPVDQFVFEFPVVYRDTRAPNDLLPMCFSDGLIAAAIAPKSIRAVQPADWKGTIDPDIVINRVKAALTPAEDAVLKSRDHNTYDAIGIGLWLFKRIKTGR